MQTDSSTSPPELARHPEEASTPAVQPRTLRWWPAACLVGLMFLLRMIPALVESPSLPVIFASFLGPAVAGVLILLWWVTFSRSTIRERLLGALLTIALIGISITLLHPSLANMNAIMYVVPYGAGAFAVSLCLLAAQPRWRLPVALGAVALTLGYWDLLQSAGVDGTFQPELSWRWIPTAEERYLQTVASQSADTPSPAPAEKILLADAAWPAFRGAARDGRQPGIVLKSNWEETPPKSIWKKPIGPGWSSFSVAGNRLFTQEQRGEDEAVVCLNASTGETIWATTYPSRFWEAVAGAGPRATPTIADEGLFALGANGVLLALDPVTGAKRWTRDLQVDAGRKPPMWGFASSPLVVQGLVIVHAGGAENKGVLAYRVADGELAWAVPSGDHSYSSAQLATFDGVSGLLMSTNAGLQFLDVADGHTIWEHRWAGDNYRALQPLVVGNSAFIATSLGLGTRKVTARQKGDQWEVTEDWTSRDLKPDFNDFVEYQNSLYGFDGNIFTCVSLETGKRAWKRGRYGNGQVLLLPDAGQLLVTSETGEVVLLKADPAKPVELARFPAIEGKTWNHPVVIGSKLYLRNAEMAACYELALEQLPEQQSQSVVQQGN